MRTVQQPLATWNPVRDVWETPGTASLFCGHLGVYSETWPQSGMTANGVAYELPTWARRMAGSGFSSSPGADTPLLRTVAAVEADGGPLSPAMAKHRGQTLRLSGQMIDLVDPEQLPQPDRLLKTPTSQLAVNGGSQHPDKRKSGGHGPTLADEVEHLLPTPVCPAPHDSRQSAGKIRPRRDGYGPELTTLFDPETGELQNEPPLLGTPRAAEWKGSGPVGSKSYQHWLEHGYETGGKLPDMGDQVKELMMPSLLADGDTGELMPTPGANLGDHSRDHGQNPERRKELGRQVSLADVACYLPTPRASDGTKGGPNQRGSAGDLMLPSAVHLLQTPSVADGTGGHATRSGGRSDEKLLPGQAVEMATNWGPYEPAVRRWEAILGRPAPAPTEPTAKGTQRLAPRFCEWMMGQPDGWITDPAIGISRADQLKACGNGVVTAQATAAIRDMLDAFDALEAAA